MSTIPSTPAASNKEAVAKRIADGHRAVDPSITAIYRVESPGRESDPSEPIKLLEINPNTTISGILPVWLSADAAAGIYFPSIVIEIHPSEWPQLQSGQLVLPHGWILDLAKPF